MSSTPRRRADVLPFTVRGRAAPSDASLPSELTSNLVLLFLSSLPGSIGATPLMSDAEMSPRRRTTTHQSHRLRSQEKIFSGSCQMRSCFSMPVDPPMRKGEYATERRETGCGHVERWAEGSPNRFANPVNGCDRSKRSTRPETSSFLMRN